MELPENLNQVYTLGHRLYKTIYGKVYVLRLKDHRRSKERAVLKIGRSKIDHGLPEHNEARLLSKLEHFNIIKMISWRHQESQDFMVLEKMTGSLRGYQLFKGGFFEADEAYVYLKQMASVLDYLHSVELIHRDVKSENILIDLEHDWNGSHLLKLCDFSFSLYAREIDSDKELRGTLDFLSPEAVKEEKITTAIDVWALGATYYDWIVGKPPFQKPGYKQTYQAIVNDEPDYSLCDQAQTFLLKQMLEKDPKKRITAPLLNTMVNKYQEGMINIRAIKEMTGGDKIEARKLITTFEWYTRQQKYETHHFKSMEDIWSICHLNDCNEEDFELSKEGWVSFRSDEWIKFPENSGHLNEQFLDYCKGKTRKNPDYLYTLTSGHHWSENSQIVLDIYKDAIIFKIDGTEVVPDEQDYMRYLITFFGCLIYSPDPKFIDTDLSKNGNRCDLDETKEILQKIYSMYLAYDYELLYGCKESVMEKLTEYEPVKPQTIGELLSVIGDGTRYEELGDFLYFEYPDSVMFVSECFDRELYDHFGLTMGPEDNKFLVYYNR